jgi:outer membrane immunogenic protein
MRRWMLAAAVAVTAQGAQAADLPDLSDLPVLRGGLTDGLSQPTVNWQGVYVGGHASYSSANMDFSKATQPLTNFMLENTYIQQEVSGWTLLGKTSPVSPGFGGFVGYNAQWDDALLGVEANYTHLSNLNGSQSNNSLPSITVPGSCVTPPAGDTDQCSAQLSGAASAQITDVMTLRGRAGYAFGNFMPYMFGGLALGRAVVTNSATVVETDAFYNSTTNAYDRSQTQTYAQSQSSTMFVYGYTAGVGMEAMLAGGLFARAEYEYIKFNSVRDINIQMSTVRAGLGYKF